MTYVFSDNLRIIRMKDQTIMMDLKHGKFYACNHVGGLILELLRIGDQFDSIVRRIEEQFSLPSCTVKADVQHFLESLVRRDLCHASS
jgi:hypothetical protein